MGKINTLIKPTSGLPPSQKRERKAAVTLIVISILNLIVSLSLFWAGAFPLIGLAFSATGSFTLMLTSACLNKKNKAKPQKKSLPISPPSPLPSSPTASPARQPILDEESPLPEWPDCSFIEVTGPDLSDQALFPATEEDVRQDFPPIGRDPTDLAAVSLDVNPPKEIRRLFFQLGELGTSGVDRTGSNLDDRNFVERRIAMVRQYIMPHAHTKQSWKDFLDKWLPGVTLGSLNDGAGDGRRLGEVIDLHRVNHDLMVKNFGKQLEVHVIGAGPIGLAGVLLWYQLGAKVVLHERFSLQSSQSVRGFAERMQPFSLQPQSYQHLSGLGLSKKRILLTFGITKEQWDTAVKTTGSEEAASFTLMRQTLMGNARKARIGAHCADYLPNLVSLPIGLMQKLLFEVIGKIQKYDEGSIDLRFEDEFTEATLDPTTNRTELTFKRSGKVSPDIIYNCAGGHINTLLGFKKITIAHMYGLGAFFPVPKEPLFEAPSRPILSRGVRLFTTNTSNWVYANIELSKTEYQTPDPLPVHKILDIFSKQSGLPRTRNFFKVQVDLSRAEAVMESNAKPSFQEGLQLIINGGDAATKPDFRTASGANVGLLGQIYLKNLFSKLLKKECDSRSFERQYTEFYRVLDKQICQIIVDLFARPLKI